MTEHSCHRSTGRHWTWPIFCFVFALGWVQAGVAGSTTVEVYYAPEDQPLDHIVTLYNRAHRYIYVAVYALTSPKAVESLAAAKKRGVDVRVITDRERLNDQKQRAAVSALRLAGVPILVNQHENLMHLKQVVMDDEINVSGSMNHTTSGNRYNDERLDVITDKTITTKARDKFLAMWNDHDRFQPWSEDR